MSDIDVLIIGSGAGGSPVAAALCAAGAKVTIVEKGKHLKKDAFDRDELMWCRRNGFVPSVQKDPHTRRNDEGKRALPTTDGWISTVVGGGTVHMGGYFLRAAPADAQQGTRFKTVGGHSAIDWAVPYKDIAKHYDAAERELGVSGVQATKMAPIVSHSVSALVDEAAKKAGVTSEATPRAILTEPRPEEKRAACAYHGLCASYGCPNDAKGAMGPTYLRQAEKTGNLTLLSETMCTGLTVDPDGQVQGAKIVTRAGEKKVLKARLVVVACGAIESARLLLLSDKRFASLGVGKNLWFSLFTEAVGFLPRESFESRFGDLMTGSPFLNRTIRMHGTLAAADQKKWGVDRSGTLQFGFVHDNPIHRAERVATENGLIFGAALKQKLHRAFTGGRQILVEGFGEQVPHPGSYVDLDPRAKDRFGLPAARITQFHHPRDRKAAITMNETAKAVLTAMGATDVAFPRKMSSTLVLQGGTCRFAADKNAGVTDVSGRVFGTKNLFVSDGGSLPSSMNVPATLTIIANAKRIAEHVKKALGGARALPVKAP